MRGLALGLPGTGAERISGIAAGLVWTQRGLAIALFNYARNLDGMQLGL